MSAGKLLAYYVPSTHWDREWYEPFQHFRYDLVEVLDEVLDTLERDERYACFQTDGQSIVIEDYLEVRPERAEQVRRLAQAGRLRLGPWYTLPDEFIVGPESLVRNLEEGLRVGRAFGNVSRVGFVCDLFGHVSQLPQILRGFGIETAYVFRGVNEDTHRAVFRWQSPDGSEVVTYRFGPREGYFDYGAKVRGAWETTRPFNLEEAAQRLIAYIDEQRQRAELDIILLFDGGDHMAIEPQTPALLDALRRGRPDVEVQHTGLDEFSAALLACRQQIPRVFRGELRDPGRLHGDGAWVIPGVLSSRVRLKQSNRAREAELCQWAEPFGLLAERLVGVPYPHSYVRHAWRYVLQNHAHDSICGCSPDQVHKDMEYRFDQARLINEKIIDRALRGLANRVRVPDLKGEEFALVLFNPTQADIDGPVDFDLWFDQKTESRFAEFFQYESKIGFRLYDPDGREIPYDYVRYHPQRRRYRRTKGKIPMGQECVVVQATAPLRIPAFGYTTVVCRPVAAVTRHPAGRLATSDRSLENEFLRLEVLDHGVLRLHDKRNGQTYERLLVFEERADIGDGWFHGVAVNDEIFSSTACPADVALVAAGACVATLRVTNRMEVPQQFEFGLRMARSHQRVPFQIDSYITLRAGSDHVEIRTVVDNQVRDHRLRVLFETGAATNTYLADSAFDVIERSIPLPPDNHTYKELAVETRPQATWTAVCDGRRGLAVIAPHLPETAVRDVPERTLALTLLRGFRRTIFTDGEEGGQSLGYHEFHYRLLPLQGTVPRVRLAEIAQLMAGGVRAVQVLPIDQPALPDRTLPPSMGAVTLAPRQAIVTAFRQHPEQGHVELRLFNPHDEPTSETVRFCFPLQRAAVTDLEGNEHEALPVRGDYEVAVTIGPRKIITLGVVPA
jgi:alpha-mannosidase